MKRILPSAALLATLAAVQISAQRFPPGYVDPAPILDAAAKEIGEATFTCVTFSGTGYGARGRPDLRERRQHRLAPHRLARQLHPHHQLAGGHERRDIRSEARLEPCVVEVRPRLAGRHAHAEGTAPDAHRQRQAMRGISTAMARRWRCRRSWRSCISWTSGSTRPASSRRRGCPAPILSRCGDGSRSKRAATATSSRRRRSTWWRSRCSASTASTPPSTRRIRSRASRPP